MSETNELKRTRDGIIETVKVVLQALVLALVVRTFFYQPFNIPSGSMKSTLLVGDYLFVSKFSYGFSKYSLPYAAIPFSGRIFGSEPERGDVAVFKLPRDNETDYIKRVIDGQTFQITSTADEGKAPPESGMGLRAVKCKKAVLP